MQTNRAFDERAFFFAMIRIGQTTLDGTHRLTRFVIIKPNALGAELGVDDVDLVPLADGLIRAFGFAGTAVDAVGRDVSAMETSSRR